MPWFMQAIGKAAITFVCWFVQIQMLFLITMLFLIDQWFKQAVFQFSKESILLATSLYKRC